MKISNDSGKKSVEVPFHKIVLLFIASCDAGELKYDKFRIVTTGNLVGAKGIADFGGPNPHSELDIYLNEKGEETHVFHYDGFLMRNIDNLRDSERMQLAIFMINTLLGWAKR